MRTLLEWNRLGFRPPASPGPSIWAEMGNWIWMMTTYSSVVVKWPRPASDLNTGSTNATQPCTISLASTGHCILHKGRHDYIFSTMKARKQLKFIFQANRIKRVNKPYLLFNFWMNIIIFVDSINEAVRIQALLIFIYMKWDEAATMWTKWYNYSIILAYWGGTAVPDQYWSEFNRNMFSSSWDQ